MNFNLCEAVADDTSCWAYQGRAKTEGLAPQRPETRSADAQRWISKRLIMLSWRIDTNGRLMQENEVRSLVRPMWGSKCVFFGLSFNQIEVHKWRGLIGETPRVPRKKPSLLERVEITNFFADSSFLNKPCCLCSTWSIIMYVCVVASGCIVGII